MAIKTLAEYGTEELATCTAAQTTASSSLTTAAQAAAAKAQTAADASKALTAELDTGASLRRQPAECERQRAPPARGRAVAGRRSRQ